MILVNPNVKIFKVEIKKEYEKYNLEYYRISKLKKNGYWSTIAKTDQAAIRNIKYQIYKKIEKEEINYFNNNSKSKIFSDIDKILDINIIS